MKTKLNKEASEKFFAFLYLENSDQNKYGSIIKGLNEQKSLGNDQYPKTITETNNVLGHHQFDNNNDKYQNNRSNDNKMYSHNKKLNETNTTHE